MSKVDIQTISSNTSQDMWDSICTISPQTLYIKEGYSYKIRLIGPVLRSKRTYIPPGILDGIASIKEIKEIVSGDKNAYDAFANKIFRSLSQRLQNEINKYEGDENAKCNSGKALIDFSKLGACASPEDLKLSQVMSCIRKLYDRNMWGNAFLSNCILSEFVESSANRLPVPATAPINWATQARVYPIVGINSSPATQAIQPDGVYDASANAPYQKKLFIFQMSRENVNDIMQKISVMVDNIDEIKDFRLSGLYAHDLNLIRQPSTVPNTKGQVVINISRDPSHLNQDNVSDILKYGIFDIAKSLKEFNRKFLSRKSGYVYFPSKTYMMPDVITNGESKQSADKLRDLYMARADEEISNMPPEAFDNNGLSDSINSLEL